MAPHETSAPAMASDASQRAIWSLLGVLASAVVLLARWLEPDPSGMGTHEQLGLPPCGFLYLTSLPCPGCGLTTSFAHMARLEITSAVGAHPLGVPLFLATCMAVPVSFYACVRAAPVVQSIERLRVSQGILLLSASAFLAWVVRVFSIVVAS